MLKKIVLAIALFTCLLTSLSAARAQSALKVGDTAPALIASVDGKPVSKFQPGHVYVLEFWATWCGPCLAAFDHLNELTQSLKGQPVTFLSITGDPQAKVERLLKARLLDTNIAFDRDDKTFAAYGVRVIPHTVIVGKDGKVAAITNPSAVTTKSLQDVLAGKTLNLPEKTNIAADLEWDKQISADATETVAQVIIQRSNADSGASRFRPNSGQIIGDGLGLNNLIQIAYNAQFYEIKSTLPSDDKVRYRISVRAPDGNDDTARALLIGILPTLVPFSARWAEEEEVVPVLRRIPGTAEIKSSSTKLGGFAQGGEIEYTGVPLKTIASVLGAMAYGMNVIDETGYSGVYDIKLTWATEETKSLEAALKAYGIQVTLEKRTVKRLLLQPASEK